MPKRVFLAYVKNKGVDQTVQYHLCCSLLDNIIYLLSTFFLYTVFFFHNRNKLAKIS